MFRPALAAAFLLACLGATLQAQVRPASADSTDVLVLDHDFTAADEIVWIFLNARQVYRAELSSPDVTLQLRARRDGQRVPRVYPISAAGFPSGSSVVEIYPDQDGEYEIRPFRIQGSRVSTRLRVYRDITESRRRMATHSRPGWEIGIELGSGWHSGFAQSSGVPLPGNDPAGGTDIEGCFSARGPDLSRLSMCVLGLSHQSQHGARNILWVYTEPRFRILGRARSGQSDWEFGALLRFGIGIIPESNDTPTTWGPGAYVARQIRSNSRRGGWSLQAAYSRALFNGFSKPLGAGGDITPKSHRITFGVGWYQ